MNIGFDAKRAVQNNTGLGNYSRYIAEILVEHCPDNRYFLFAPKRRANERLRRLHELANCSFVYPSGADRLIPALWRSGGMVKDLKRCGIDVFHGLSNELPVGIGRCKLKSVVSIHDLIFLRYPEFYRPIDRAIYRLKFEHACRAADKVIAVSECTKRDIVSFFGIPEEKIAVVYQGCHPQFQQRVPEEKMQEVRARYGLPEGFILSVGSIERRKNLLPAVKALRLLPDVHLVAVGRSTPYLREVELYARRHGLSRRLHVLHNVSFADLPAVYQLARVFVYPSYFEGFGIPVIEALSCGIPVIAARGSCLEEAGGPASVYVDPDGEDELALRIGEILGDEALANRMIKAGKEYVGRFDDGKAAAELMRIYQSL
ncbi:MAG: glycosyltransferase family 4 protein [Tannerellaceae bacterium]|jgi:glycosyltransferase involved in cell wall biosynthesis|nr:glycosyltransferase family 4 protein [Tannerellaceae bacterium]